MSSAVDWISSELPVWELAELMNFDGLEEGEGDHEITVNGKEFSISELRRIRDLRSPVCHV
jgi:hypothetical protein